MRKSSSRELTTTLKFVPNDAGLQAYIGQLMAKIKELEKTLSNAEKNAARTKPNGEAWKAHTKVIKDSNDELEKYVRLTRIVSNANISGARQGARLGIEQQRFTNTVAQGQYINARIGATNAYQAAQQSAATMHGQRGGYYDSRTVLNQHTLNTRVQGQAASRVLEGDVMNEARKWASRVKMNKKFQDDELAQLKAFYREYKGIIKQNDAQITSLLGGKVGGIGNLTGNRGGVGSRGGRGSALNFLAQATGIYGVGYLASRLGAGAMKNFVVDPVHNYMDFEKRRTFIGSTINTFNDVYKNGKLITDSGEKYVAGQSLAKGVYGELRKLAVESPLTLKELADTFSVGYPSLARKGLNMSQSMRVSNTVASIGKMMGLPEQAFSQDLRALNTGEYRTAQTFQTMGFSQQEFKKLSGMQGDEFMKFFGEKAKEFQKGMDEFDTTLTSSVDRVIDSLYNATLTIGEKLAPTIKKYADQISETIKTWEKDGTLTKFATGIDSIVGGIGKMVEFVIKNAENIALAIPILNIAMIADQNAKRNASMDEGFSKQGAYLKETQIAENLRARGVTGNLDQMNIAGKIAGAKDTGEAQYYTYLYNKHMGDDIAKVNPFQMQEFLSRRGKSGTNASAWGINGSIDINGDFSRLMKNYPYIEKMGPEQAKAFTVARNRRLGEGQAKKKQADAVANAYTMKNKPTPPADIKGAGGSGTGVTTGYIRPNTSAIDNQINGLKAKLIEYTNLPDNMSAYTKAAYAQEAAQISLQLAGAEARKAEILASAEEVSYKGGMRVQRGTTPGVDSGNWKILKAALPSGFSISSGFATKGHNKGSLHYTGDAVDISIGGKSTAEVNAMIKSMRGKGFSVNDERTRPKGQKVWGGPHIHASIPASGVMLNDKQSETAKRTRIKNNDSVASAKLNVMQAAKEAENAAITLQIAKENLRRFKVSTAYNNAGALQGILADNPSLTEIEKLNFQSRQFNQQEDLAAGNSFSQALQMGVPMLEAVAMSFGASGARKQAFEANMGKRRVASNVAKQAKMKAWLNDFEIGNIQRQGSLAGLSGSELKIQQLENQYSKQADRLGSITGESAIADFNKELAKLRVSINEQISVIKRDTAIRQATLQISLNKASVLAEDKYMGNTPGLIERFDRQTGDMIAQRQLPNNSTKMMLMLSGLSSEQADQIIEANVKQARAPGRNSMSNNLLLQNSIISGAGAFFNTGDVASGLSAFLGGSMGDFGLGFGSKKFGNASALLGSNGNFKNLFKNKGAMSDFGGSIVQELAPGLFGRGNHSDMGSQLGGMAAGFMPSLGAWAGPVGALGGALLGSLFKKKSGPSPEEQAAKDHAKRVEQLLNNIDKSLRPQADYFKSIRSDVLFGSASRWFSGRAYSGLALSNSLGRL